MTVTNRSGALLAVPGVLLVAAFFLPWIDLLGQTASGYDIATTDYLSGKRFLLWLAPLCGAVLALAALSGSKSRDAGLVAGAVVVLPTLYYVGKGMMFGTSWGLWLVLIGAAWLLVLALANKPQQMALPSALIIAGFFLPWTTNVFADFASWGATGFDIAREDDTLAKLLGLPSPKMAYLVPLAGVVGLLASLVNSKSSRVAGGAAGALVIGWLAYVALFSVTGWGLWLTFAAGVAALLMSLRR